MTVEENLKKLNLSIPIAPDPVGNYAAYVKSNNLIFISGQLPIDTNGKLLKGKLGLDLNKLHLGSDRKKSPRNFRCWTERSRGLPWPQSYAVGSQSVPCQHR